MSKKKSNEEDVNDGYYHLINDINKYPKCWCYLVWSKRGPGKTYSTLRYSKNHSIKIIYIKRTIDDVELICSADKIFDHFDPSPYTPLNRDLGWNIKPVKIDEGLAFFIEKDAEGNPIGEPVAYCLALSAIKKFKGFDFSDCDWLVLDEFIPQAGEIVKRAEGEQILSLYMTVSRDRQKRGRKPLKLILLANAEEISTPVTNTLEVVDAMADLNASGESHLYIEDRDIMLHHITNEEVPLQEEEKDGIYKAMIHTKWGQKAFEGTFASNDFSNVMKCSLKGMRCYIRVKHNNNHFYIYMNPNTGFTYMCNSRNNFDFDYDLNLENDQKRFYNEQIFDLRYRCINDMMKFKSYSMYDLIMNYKKFFKI